MDADGFSFKEVLLEVRSDIKDLRRMIDRIDREGSIGTKNDLTDHESRLRILEKVHYKWSGAIALVVAAASFVFAFIH